MIFCQEENALSMFVVLCCSPHSRAVWSACCVRMILLEQEVCGKLEYLIPISPHSLKATDCGASGEGRARDWWGPAACGSPDTGQNVCLDHEIYQGVKIHLDTRITP